jgi:ribosomal protein L19E
MGEMRIITSYAQEEVKHLPAKMRKSGDSKVIWDPYNDDEVEAAEAQFDVLIDKGFKAYRVDKKGEKTGKPIKRFKSDIGRLIMVPSLAGG